MRDEWKTAIQTHILKLRNHLRSSNITLTEFYNNKSRNYSTGGNGTSTGFIARYALDSYQHHHHHHHHHYKCHHNHYCHRQYNHHHHHHHHYRTKPNYILSCQLNSSNNSIPLRMDGWMKKQGT